MTHSWFCAGPCRARRVLFHVWPLGDSLSKGWKCEADWDMMGGYWPLGSFWVPYSLIIFMYKS